MDLRYINSPFPDNHDGFDYAPYSVHDSIQDEQNEAMQASQSARQNKLMSMLASIFK